MDQRRDPVTGSIISEEDHQKDVENWKERTEHFVAKLDATDPEALCDLFCSFLAEQSRGSLRTGPNIPLCDHGSDSYVSDHALLTSAIAYCLGYDGVDNIHLIRLAALSHEFPPEVQTEFAKRVAPSTSAFITQAWAMLHRQTVTLVQALQTENSLATFADQPDGTDKNLALLWLAHLSASQPLGNQTLELPNKTSLTVIQQRADFVSHPLVTYGSAPQHKIGLVHGGATKIKNYVFESAKLPEMRGGSALLDRLNQVDSRQLFKNAPECVIYANGGDLLALTPADQAQTCASNLEKLYTKETLTAQSVFVADVYSLLELQYGLRPQEFWADDYAAQLGNSSAEHQALLRDYYGNPQHKTDQGEPGWTDTMCFYQRKGFGECTTHLALKRTRRRDGNSDAARVTLLSPYFETLPFGQYCTSCDRRTAVVRIPDLNDALCEPCLRKRWTGMFMRRGERHDDLFKRVTQWHPRLERNAGISFHPWYRQFEQYLDEYNGNLKSDYLENCEGAEWAKLNLKGSNKQDSSGINSASDLGELGQTAQPEGFIGLVYADGNNVGALIEKIRTPAAYRQFANRLFYATQNAVFQALATHLQPVIVKDEKGKRMLIHPFEIISIGGDDLFLILPADKALPIAHSIASYIEQIFSDGVADYAIQTRPVQRYDPDAYQPSGKPRISLAAGVLLAAQNTPIFFLLDLLEDLLKSAKKAAKDRKHQGYMSGTIDFMSLKSTGMLTSNVGEFRAIALKQEHSETNDCLHLTARPYTTHEVAGLLATVNTLKQADFPRSQLHQLRTLLPTGRFVSSLSYLYFSSRLRGGHPALLRKNLDQAWHTPLSDPVPWRRRQAWKKQADKKTHWETMLADLIEIYDFVAKVEEG